jgi:hypothetical protein
MSDRSGEQIVIHLSDGGKKFMERLTMNKKQISFGGVKFQEIKQGRR